MTTFTKTFSTLAAALVLMTAVSAQAAPSDLVVKENASGLSAGSQNNMEYKWEQTFRNSDALLSTTLNDGLPTYAQSFDKIFSPTNP